MKTAARAMARIDALFMGPLLLFVYYTAVYFTAPVTRGAKNRLLIYLLARKRKIARGKK
jgi:hypothetical protein